MGQMRVLDSTGDTVFAWAPEDDEAVANAEKHFRELVETERRMAFARPTAGTADDAVLIRSFDKTAEEILMVRPIQGG